jgi:hypothetical protein
MKASPARRAAIFFAFALGLPLLLTGCPKKPPPVVDAGEPPPPPSTASVTELAPLIEDAGDEGGDGEAGPKKYTGPGVNTNQARIQMCCNSMRAEARKLGAGSPEAFQLNAAAGQCDVFAKQVGPAGNAPELNQLRQILRSIKVPAACQF